MLALARAQTPLEIKLQAVAALHSEAMLKQAEREFRGQHRRVHQLAKQRYLGLVAQRENRAQAAQLIEAAQALVAEAVIPLNHAVELDRAWLALDAGLLEPNQRDAFAALSAQLTTLTRARADHEQQLRRWQAQAQQALQQLQATARAAAAGTQEREALAAAVLAARAVAEAAPEGQATGALSAALQTAVELDARLDVLARLLGDPAAAPAAAAAEARLDPLLQWQQMPPLDDSALAELLNQRVAHWQAELDRARAERQAHKRERAKDQRLATRLERGEALIAALDSAEATLAAGHLDEAQRLLVQIDELQGGGAPAEALHTRIAQLQAQFAELRGWQHWAGGRARDDLTLQAEALAAATGGESEGPSLKLSIAQRTELIDDLHARWKELDRLGGATNRALWQRFDAALKIAYQPVAAHGAALRAAREQNLAARQQLLETLELIPLPDAAAEVAAPPDLRALAAALEQFRLDWRKLGPIEHTVPHKAREALLQRLNTAVGRLETPLDSARNQAQREREGLVARAKALGSAAGANALALDLVAQARALQAEWREHARSLPLARGIEKALWSEFKTAIDALFSAREAAYNARDAEFKANGAERFALIERLEALAEAAPAELKRALPEIDAQWQRAGPPLRADAAALEARFRGAREAVRLWLAGSEQRGWLARCDALEAKLRLCVEREGAAGAEPAALAEQWAAMAMLPPAWEQALVRRAGLSSDATAAKAETARTATDELLVQIEAAWGLASPAAFEAARRELKLRAMKEALEGRRGVRAAPLAPEEVFATLLGRTGLDAIQRERLAMVIAALRRRGATHPA